jgi:hypothetical protein
MTRVRRLALAPVLLASSLACTATQNPPDANENPDGRRQPKQKPDRACTEMACQDAATIDTKLTAAQASLGKHEFSIEVDGVAQTCTVEFTVATQLAYASCSAPGTSLWFGPVMRGVTVPQEVGGQATVMHAEEPVPGEFQWQLSLFGTPAKAHVVHSHAGNVVLDQTAEFGSYGDHRPNGEGCEPVCKVANVQWTGPRG